MKRAPRIAAGVSLSAAMAAGLSGSAEAARPDFPPITAGQEAAYDTYFKAAEEYWAQQGVQGLEDVKIKYISGNEIGRCALLFDATADSSSRYCITNKTIYYTARDIASDSGQPYRQMFGIGHEYGHAVEDAEGVLLTHMPRTNELGATCLAGKFMIKVYPAQVIMAGAADVMNKSTITTVVGGSDLIHGTAEAQLTALGEGITEQDCTKYGV